MPQLLQEPVHVAENAAGTATGDARENTVGPGAPGSTGDEALRYRRCAWCRSATEYTRTLCRVCGSTELHEERSEGSGAISWTTKLERTQELVHRIRQTCVVVLDEGFTVPATVEAQGMEALPTGTRVRLAGREPGEKAALFVPA
ncbi:PhlB family protein [Actinacidiphila rubida]|uniref:DUF35 domain-containing protein n=1 Tax=Actinacidiphila rubida TaxID=310780 RepID=A0A1H8RLR9_9ACTN|nr:hypothetical protein [Actinacidiphila rubida]SEO67499.1 hypothetical protein SAMN05216267_103580 [Actinacidiphila rubida]